MLAREEPDLPVLVPHLDGALLDGDDEGALRHAGRELRPVDDDPAVRGVHLERLPGLLPRHLERGLALLELDPDPRLDGPDDELGALLHPDAAPVGEDEGRALALLGDDAVPLGEGAACDHRERRPGPGPDHEAEDGQEDGRRDRRAAPGDERGGPRRDLEAVEEGLVVSFRRPRELPEEAVHGPGRAVEVEAGFRVAIHGSPPPVRRRTHSARVSRARWSRFRITTSVVPIRTAISVHERFSA